MMRGLEIRREHGTSFQQEAEITKVGGRTIWSVTKTR